MIPRPMVAERIRAALQRSPVVALVGPRQVGKTTLARELLPPDDSAYFDLEDPTSLARLESPATTLERLEGLVVIDEIQRRPDLFPLLRVLVDRDPSPARFLVLGSAAPQLLRQSSETLAGRIEVIQVDGFHADEVPETVQSLWIRGGFPRSILANDDESSLVWRKQFIQTYLERDIPQFGIGIPAVTLQRFWMMLAHRHGATWNGSDMARSMGVSQPTARRYLDLLTNLFLVRQLQPWHENIGKRQIRSPKTYIRDSGLLHALLGLQDRQTLESHPALGGSWEGFVIEEMLAQVRPESAWFWGTHQGAELDLLMLSGGRRVGVEVKYQDAPRMTRSMRIAQEALHLDELVVIHPGLRSYELDNGARAMSLPDALIHWS